MRARIILLTLAALAAAPPSSADVKLDENRGLILETGKQGPTFTLGGRLLGDFGQFQPDVTPLNDGFVWRRVRPEFMVEWGDVRARADYELGDVHKGWRQAWIEYKGFRHTSLKLGLQPIPFGLEGTMSSNDVPFVERPLPFTFAPSLLVGIAARKWGDRWSATVGAFGNDIANEDSRKLDGRSVVVRLTGLPYERHGGRVHLGVSAEYRDAKQAATLRYRARPESYVETVRLVDTGALPAVKSVLSYGVEAAWQQGPFMASSEYLAASVSRSGLPELSFDGWYASATWLMTGERRSYTESLGAFGGVDPRNKWGALELKARISEVNLTDSDVAGGHEQNVAFGLNWYFKHHIRVMVEHVLVDAKPNSLGVNESPNITQMRLQVAF